MATCFDSIIGIKSICTESTGSSPFYIEDIGITANEADFYINADFSSGQQLIEDKIRFATDLVRKTIQNHFSSHIISKTLIDSELLGDYQDSLVIKSGVAASYGGIALTLNNQRSYFSVFVNAISLQVNATQNVSVLVYDLISGTLLDTIIIACTANVISTKVVNKTYTSSKRKLDLIFVYDISALSSNNTLLSNQNCTTCNGFSYTNYYITSQAVYISQAATKIRSSLTSNTHTFGLSVNYSVECSIDNWLCEIANLMALPILYKSGIEIMNYALYYSNRQNSNTNIDFERNKERLAAYQTAYSEALEATIKKINLPKNDICFICNESVKSMVILP